MSPDGKLIASSGKYGEIHLFTAKSKEWITTLKMNGTVNALTFNSDGKRMYSFGGNILYVVCFILNFTNYYMQENDL
jgi:WD40 repeat protein